MRPCPHCTKAIKDNAEICKWCLRPVGPETEGPQVTNDAVAKARGAREAGARLFRSRCH
jgi:hypothetical protein